jgi:hypothetical protein
MKQLSTLLTYASLLLTLLLSTGSVSWSQCYNCSANFPTGTFSTTSNSLVTVNTCIYGGEYSNYSVTSGQNYTWTTCGDNSFDTQLTLFSGGCGGTVLGYSDDACGTQSTITWTATFTGTVTLLVSRYNCGAQSACMTVQWSCNTCGVVVNPPADYTHPITGLNGEKIGACLVNDCGPFTYADNGNGSANYSNSIYTVAYSPNNAPYRVFCPDAAGQCLSVTFSQFQTANANDVLWVRNGPTEFSPTFTAAPMQTTLWGGAYTYGLYGNLSGSTPFTFTSTDPSGCLTFNFLSSDVTNSAGWYSTLQCVPCAGGPNGTDNNDCINATPLCSTASVPANSSGPGLVAEGCVWGSCPAGGENHTNWYRFTAATSGTLNFVIDPIVNSDDYDYMVFGPNVTCGSLGTPIRCSDSGTSGNTGLTDVNPNQNSEDVYGDGWTETLNIVAGQSYYLVVDEWSANSGSGYTLSFTGTATLDCTILPIELISFEAEYLPEKDEVELHWATASERDNDFFEIERSSNGIDYEIIAKVPGQGTTDIETHYYALDPSPEVGVNYYRLNQWDKNGSGKYSEVIAVNILDEAYDLLAVFPNPTTGTTEVSFNCYSKGDAVVNVLTPDGKIVMSQSIETVKGGNKIAIDLSNQRSGMYLVEIITKEKDYKARLYKQ